MTMAYIWGFLTGAAFVVVLLVMMTPTPPPPPRPRLRPEEPAQDPAWWPAGVKRD